MKTDSLLGVGTELMLGRTCNSLNISHPSGTNFSNAHRTTYLLFFFPLIATAILEGKGGANASSCFSSISPLASMTQQVNIHEFSLKWREHKNKRISKSSNYNIQQNPYSLSEMHKQKRTIDPRFQKFSLYLLFYRQLHLSIFKIPKIMPSRMWREFRKAHVEGTLQGRETVNTRWNCRIDWKGEENEEMMIWEDTTTVLPN